MKNKSVHQLLLGSRPAEKRGNQAFVERTMQAVRQASVSEAFEASLRANGKPHSRRESLLARFRHLPKYAMVAVAAVGILLISGTTYAAIRWLEPMINITGSSLEEQENKRLYTVDIKNCGIEVGGETVDNGHQVFEVANDVKLSDAQIKKVINDSCNYQQILNLMNTRWPNDPSWPMSPTAGQVFVSIEPGTGGANVLNDPWVGKITGISDGHIQLTTTLYQEYIGPKSFPAGQDVPDMSKLYKYYPKGKQVVHDLAIDNNAEVIDNGHDSSVGKLKVGDTVVFMSQVTRTVNADKTWSDPSDVKVVRLIKADIDPANVMNMGVGNPAIVGGVNRLEGCQGNGQYLCLSGKDDGSVNNDLVYSYSGNLEAPSAQSKQFIGNEKYFRKDIDMNGKDTGNYFHRVDGRITKIDGTTITLLTRGKKVDHVTVDLPYDAVKQHNDNSKLDVSVGDMITVDYMQKSGEDLTHVKSSDLMSLLLVERRMPDGSLTKY